MLAVLCIGFGLSAMADYTVSGSCNGVAVPSVTCTCSSATLVCTANPPYIQCDCGG